MFFPQNVTFRKEKKRPLPGCWSQSSGVGMHQNPHFQSKPVENWKNPKNQPQINHRNYPLFLSLLYYVWWVP